jgi:hypothetical protein
MLVCRFLVDDEERFLPQTSMTFRMTEAKKRKEKQLLPLCPLMSPFKNARYTSRNTDANSHASWQTDEKPKANHPEH